MNNDIDELKAINKDLEARLEKEQAKYRDLLMDRGHEKEIAKSCLQLFGDSYGRKGIQIPLDDEIKKAISKYIYKQICDIFQNDEGLQDRFIKQALNFKKAFVRIFKPLVKEMIEDLDFNVRFESQKEEDKWK